MRKLLIALVRLGFNLIAKVEYQGLENLHYTGPTLVVANHLGRLDAPLILSLDQFTNHPNLVVVVAEKYKKYWIYRWAVKVMDFLWVDRYNTDVRALREVIKRLQTNGIMVIAPEGTRSSTEALMKAKSGAAYIAAKTGAMLIPVAVTGTEDRYVKQQLRRLARPRIILRIGQPFQIGELPQSSKSEFLDRATDEIMCQIGALLPVKYQGYYQQHPRLVELRNQVGS